MAIQKVATVGNKEIIPGRRALTKPTHTRKDVNVHKDELFLKQTGFDCFPTQYGILMIEHNIITDRFRKPRTRTLSQRQNSTSVKTTRQKTEEEKRQTSATKRRHLLETRIKSIENNELSTSQKSDEGKTEQNVQSKMCRIKLKMMSTCLR